MPSDPLSPDELVARAQAWLRADPDPETQAELRGLLEGGGDHAVAVPDLDGLARRFDGRLEFGTAGLRGPMGAGPRRMNRVVVRRAAAGLMRYLGAGATVVVGYDARHKSRTFAEDTARVVAGSGGTAVLLPEPAPTPLVAFAVRELECSAGVVCTASHNPATDNGFKVYLDDGVQLGAPVDRLIASAIDEIELDALPLSDLDDPAVRFAGDDVVEAYLDRAAALIDLGARRLEVVYTPLHGVGAALTMALFERAGFNAPHLVPAQATPDGDFPTVPYPNPEEPGALDLAISEATARSADLVLAHDPDADRLGVAVPRSGEWRRLTGDQIGALLADHLLRRDTNPDRLVVDTVVSSGLLERLASEHGARHLQTLTGFKWVMRAAVDHPAWPFVFAYEEALGYAVSDLVRDKDGVTAALVFAALVAEVQDRGETVWDRLEAMARRHGLFATQTWSFRFDGPEADAQVGSLMRRLRSDLPNRVGERGVIRVDDLLVGASLPPTDAIVLHLDGGVRVIVRPSGTEPKVKAYARVVIALDDGPDAFDTAESRATALFGDLRRDVSTLLSA